MKVAHLYVDLERYFSSQNFAFYCICICIVVVFVFVLRRTSFGSGTTVWRRLNARWQV